MVGWSILSILILGKFANEKGFVGFTIDYGKFLIISDVGS